jgi:DNA repair exonuclease SbcCD ATPase subunit
MLVRPNCDVPRSSTTVYVAMTNPDLQKTIRALENYLDPNHHIFDMNNVRNAIALLKAQQEQIEQLTDRVESKVHGYNKLFTELQAQQERIADLEEFSSICPDCGCRRIYPQTGYRE